VSTTDADFPPKLEVKNRAALRIDRQSGRINSHVRLIRLTIIRIERGNHVPAARIDIEKAEFEVPVVTIGSVQLAYSGMLRRARRD